MVTVKKKNGGIPITTDLTRLNDHVIPERYPHPRIEDIVLNTAGSKVFSKLDLKKGYFQIPLSLESRDFTTTITPLGLQEVRQDAIGTERL